MVTTYSTKCAATTNSSANTDDVFIEIQAASNTSIFIKRVTITSHDTTPDDVMMQCRMTRNSAAASFTTGTSITAPVPNRVNSPSTLAAAGCANITIKTGTNQPNTVGTLTDTFKTWNFNQRAGWDWMARDASSMMESGVNGRIELVVQASAASQLCTVEVEWEV